MCLAPSIDDCGGTRRIVPNHTIPASSAVPPTSARQTNALLAWAEPAKIASKDVSVTMMPIVAIKYRIAKSLNW